MVVSSHKAGHRQRLLSRASCHEERPRLPLVVEHEDHRLAIRLMPYFDRRVLLLNQAQIKMPLARLERLGVGRRETEVFSELKYGKTNAEIGTILELSPRTVQKHLEPIYQRLGVENRTAAVARAFEMLPMDRLNR
jgi:DNA-binding NarL/FixJ family response regulator